MATAVASLLIPLSSWFYSVQSCVPDPYLVRSDALEATQLDDEVFHVRQAQHYCAGSFHIWDSKITTPPGLYFLSTLASPLLGCNITILRASSALCICVLAFVIARTYTLRQARSPLAQHNALNIVLLPPLFFFAALYYTDVASTLSVLLFHAIFLRAYRNGSGIKAQISLVLVGLASLFFRQTNIFWVAIFPAGIALVHELDQGHDAVRDSMHRGSQGFGDSIYNVAKTSWKMHVVYSPAVQEAWLEDYFRTTLSMATCAVQFASSPAGARRLLFVLAPYLTLLIAFTGFILVNGSVVLGDKTNHVATLHLSQMLYLWPYVAFFSWSLLLPYILLVPLTLFSRVSNMSIPNSILPSSRQHLLPRLTIMALWTCIAIAIIHFNTIVHPFTLADNRHYTFYVFRLLLRPWFVRYLAAPIYAFCGWASIQALGNGASASFTTKTQNWTHNTMPVPDGIHAATTSFVLVWLATTALQLITAPLVEPRYFILPWLFWRIHLPVSSSSSSSAEPSKSADSTKPAQPQSWTPDLRLCLETAWLLLTNAVTGFIFLAWGFSWPQEPGAVQRFMW